MADSTRTGRIGRHVDSTDPIADAQAHGADVAQIFIGDPQGWKGHEVLYPAGPEALRDAAGEAGIALVVHAPYVINVATTNNRIRIPSRKMLQRQVDLAAEIDAIGVVVHGGHVTSGDDPEVGFDNWRKAVDQLEAAVPIFVENTAGGDHSMARRLERIAPLWEAILTADGGDRVGFCLDTCHAHAGGLDLATVVDDIRAITGRIDLVHCNDSRDEADSGADRHANLGHGRIDPDLLVGVARDAEAPVVCETSAEHDDVAWLRERLT